MENYLLYDDMYVGMEFGEVTYELKPEQVENYIKAVEEESDPERLTAPPTVAAIFTTIRVALKDHKMPPGAIHAKQYYKFVKPVKAGDKLKIKVKIADKFLKKERKYAIIESRVENEAGEHLLTGRMGGIWPR
jgi:3-hydroxybutyryl-CoA dehydratase